MNEREALKRWRAAEAAGREAEAEAAMAALLARVPRPAPLPGFAARVAALAAEEAARRRAPAASPLRPFAIAAALMLALGGLAALMSRVAGPLAGSLSEQLTVATLIDGLAAAVTGTARWLAGAFGVWEVLAEVGRAAATAAGTTPVLAGILVALALAALSLRLLSDLIATERSWTDVPSHR